MVGRPDWLGKGTLRFSTRIALSLGVLNGSALMRPQRERVPKEFED
jgi:hypothetical protein